MAWEVGNKKKCGILWIWNLKESNVDWSTQYSTTFENKLATQVTINLKDLSWDEPTEDLHLGLHQNIHKDAQVWNDEFWGKPKRKFHPNSPPISLVIAKSVNINRISKPFMVLNRKFNSNQMSIWYIAKRPHNEILMQHFLILDPADKWHLAVNYFTLHSVDWNSWLKRI